MAISRSTIEFVNDRDGKPLLSIDTSDKEQPYTLRVARMNGEQLTDLQEAIGAALESGSRGGVPAPKSGVGKVPAQPAKT